MKITKSCGMYKAIYHKGSFYGYLKRGNNKTLKFHKNNFSFLN